MNGLQILTICFMLVNRPLYTVGFVSLSNGRTCQLIDGKYSFEDGKRVDKSMCIKRQSTVMLNTMSFQDSSEEIEEKTKNRGKVNEIDFCMAPSDVSLSGSYFRSEEEGLLSLTRCLNSVTNRALRRILLSRSWPSPEALNRSLRQAQESASVVSSSSSSSSRSSTKCPIPRSILNIITRRKITKRSKGDIVSSKKSKFSKGERSEAVWVKDQMDAFRDKYYSEAGYEYAEAYLECILSLATKNVESELVDGVLENGVYDESYRRFLSVLASVGVTFDFEGGKKRIGAKLKDEDICLSVMDKIDLKSQIKTPKTEADLGAILLSSSEPSMTRQLNVLSNIVRRSLLFGGDEELLVLLETLEADLPFFVGRWDNSQDIDAGIQYLNSLIKLLKNCYLQGFVNDLESTVPLRRSFANSYERLMANLVEMGSGYIKPKPLLDFKNFYSRNNIPKTPRDEFGRFALWEVALRNKVYKYEAYPADLVGQWTVKDEIRGKSLGATTVELLSGGKVSVVSPLMGLRWRLDPGPTHLDTCTFQVLNDDGTILEYKGFLDRGARLESRFSKRPIKIRGAVTFQMRDNVFMSEGYRKDMLPIDYKIDTTRFLMTKIINT